MCKDCGRISLEATRASDIRSRVFRSQQTDEPRPKRLATMSASNARSRAAETDEHRQECLATVRASNARSRAPETDEHRQKRLAAKRASYARSLSDETCEKRQKRLDARLRATEIAKERRQRLDVIKLIGSAGHAYLLFL